MHSHQVLVLELPLLCLLRISLRATSLYRLAERSNPSSQMAELPPIALTVAVAITAWQSHRLVTLPVIPRILDGELTTAWLAPCISESVVAGLAPFMCYMLVHSPSYAVWAFAISLNVMGSFGFAMAVFIHGKYGPPEPVLARGRDRSGNVAEVRIQRNPLILKSWLLLNLLAELACLVCLLHASVPSFLNHQYMIGTVMKLTAGPLQGKWIGICAVGWCFVGIPGLVLQPKSQLI